VCPMATELDLVQHLVALMLTETDYGEHKNQ
jgi:hypothetical protein